jgi:hypothetical protein
LIYASNKHAIVSDDNINMLGGTISVTQAAADAIHAYHNFQMSGGNFTLVATESGVESEAGFVSISGGAMGITASSDGITTSYTGNRYNNTSVRSNHRRNTYDQCLWRKGKSYQ